MEEKDLHLEPEEDKDVEGHVDLNRVDAAKKVDAGHADDDDDVEGHVDLNRVDAANVDAGNVDI